METTKHHRNWEGCTPSPMSPSRLIATLPLASLIALPLLAGCAQSATTKWAQKSAIIQPADRPAALSVFSAMTPDDGEEVQ